MAGEEDAEATRERTSDADDSAEDVEATRERSSDAVSSAEQATEGQADARDGAAGATSDTDEQTEEPPAEESDAEGSPVEESDAAEAASESEDSGVTTEAKEEIDQAAEAFVEMEERIGHPGERAVRARAIDVEKVSAAQVPDDFPYEITTDDALALTLVLVDSNERTVTTYFNWPDEAADRRLAHLLDLTGVSVDRFANLHGKEILLEVEDAHYVPMLPKAGPRGDDRAIYGVLAGIAPSLLITLLMFVGFNQIPGSIALFLFLLWLVSTFVVLPVSTYLDAWHLRTRTDWDGGPLFWAFLSMIPFLNILAVPAYLISRESSHPIA